MIRILRNHLDGLILLNPPSKICGRSVYLCKNHDCYKNALKKNRLSKMLKAKVNEEILAKIEALLSQ